MTHKDFSYYHNVITSISKSKALKDGSLTEGLRFILEKVANTLHLSQVGYWSFDENKNEIKNEITFRLDENSFFMGGALSQEQAPAYFENILEEQVISANDVHHHPATVELVELYLRPNNIKSLLDVPVIIEGKFVGIICCEQKDDQRDWSEDEKYFVTIASHLISHLIESDRRAKLLRLIEKENVISGEAQIKNLLMSLPISLAILDKESRYLAYSDSWKQNFSFKYQNPIGRFVWDCHENYQDVWVQRILRAQSGERLKMDEELIQGPDGQNVWITWQLEPWKNFQGQHSGVVVICDDITLRKEADIKLNNTEKLTALGEMAGGIAHEINNPLSILKGFVDLMQKKINQGQFKQEDFDQYLQKSSATINRISRVVRAMKKISRDSSRDLLEVVDISLLIDDAREIMTEKFKAKEIDFSVNLPSEKVLVQCRPIELSQILLNLLTNAFQAITEKGWIRIDVIPGVKTKVLITDSGKGIPPELQDKIFQPFFTTKDVGQGTGLGLSISKKMIEGQGGVLKLNPESKNTQFVIEL